MYKKKDTNECQDILATVAQFPDSAEIQSPRRVTQPWSGTREHLTDLARGMADNATAKEVIEQLSTPRLFEEMALAEVDGILIENAGQPIVHLQTDRQAFETVTIDVDDVKKVAELVETVKARQRRKWFTIVAGSVAVFSVVKWLWKGKSN